jgi:hypothetical protein
VHCQFLSAKALEHAVTLKQTEHWGWGTCKLAENLRGTFPARFTVLIRFKES